MKTVPNQEETAVYVEALLALRGNRLEDVTLNEAFLLARWTTLEPAYLRIYHRGIPEQYRDAVSSFRTLPDDRRLDLSTIDFGDVTFSEEVASEPELCTVSFSLIGFDSTMETATLRARLHCEPEQPATLDLLLCLKRTERGWVATDFARLANNSLERRWQASN